MQNISIVVPVCNEGANIPLLIKAIRHCMQAAQLQYEIIFVDDHSTDNTPKIIKKYSKNYPVKYFLKKGKKGKAYSLVEGFEKSLYEIIAMIDGDLQYPAEAIPQMVQKIAHGADVVASRRDEYITSVTRKFVSASFNRIFGEFLCGLPHDVQSGLKVFKKSVWEHVAFTPSSGWTFDLEFLYRTKKAGFCIENHTIAFGKRREGTSKVSILKTSFEIGTQALAVKTKVHPFYLQPQQNNSMKGAGVVWNKKKYITHTTLSHSQSAIQTFVTSQKVFLSFLIGSALLFLIVKPLFFLQILIAVMSIIYFIDAIFNTFLIYKSLQKTQERVFDVKDLDDLSEDTLPLYSILCPLYKEAHVLPHFLKSISKLDYPKNKLDVLLLLEEDDTDTLNKIKDMELPSYTRVIIIPLSQPKTKPKACNYGLSLAKGKYVVVFDAEDMPEPLQLKKAVLAFSRADKDVLCLQAKLNYYNTKQNLLTRFFTTEYSLWFDVMLPGLQALRTSIPLGGTSNHFKTSDLKKLEAWDPFNVTEDADLGMRLFKKGYRTEIIDSITYEEANSQFKNWIRQRSRWIKGYMQTYLVHTRNFFSMVKDMGIHTGIFQLTVGGRIAFMLINPFLWIVTLSYFIFHSFIASTIAMLYPAWVLYFAVFSLIIGNFLFLFSYMIGAAKREQWDLIKFVFLIPMYWIMMSISATIALYQLFFKPHYWEKTIHGLHLDPERLKNILPEIVIEVEQIPSEIQKFPLPFFISSIITSIAFMSLLSITNTLIQHLLDIPQAREYAIISLVGKIVFSFVAIMSLTVIPSTKNGEIDKHESKFFIRFLGSTSFLSCVGFVVFGLGATLILPHIYGDSIRAATTFLPLYTFAIACLASSSGFVTYYLAKKVYTVGFVSLAVQVGALFLLQVFHSNITTVIVCVSFVWILHLLCMINIDLNISWVKTFERNILDTLDLFQPTVSFEGNSRILIFNWRDTTHKWAGGAEVYIHELAKCWVAQGNPVTIFCGNDGNQLRNQVIDGVHIIRRGGFYTVYVWAFLYFIFKLRNNFDIVIDSENGIPFFTPLYCHKPIFLLIHHVHQEVFREHLPKGLSIIAQYIESKLMPLVYGTKDIITVSASSKKEITKLGFGQKNTIQIVHPGVKVFSFNKVPKTPHPSFLYLGRLKPYKNIDTALYAFSHIAALYPDATFTIAGWGESFKKLKALSEKLHIDKNVLFVGKVSESEKTLLLGQSWALVQPSMVEGWGLTVIEANANGTPVIASNVNGLKDSVVHEQTGLLVDLHSVDGFAHAMQLFIENALLRDNLSQQAYLWAKNFSWQKSADTLYSYILSHLTKSNLQFVDNVYTRRERFSL